MSRKDDRRNAAIAHMADTQTRLREDTLYSLKNIQIYEPSELRRLVVPSPRYKTTICEVKKTDSVSAVMDAPKDKLTAVLDFASFRNPGGGYANGAMAQEEALCAESNLYDILAQMEGEFYEPNRKNLNRSLYSSRSMYVQDVVFEKYGTGRYCDVIVCAAPNIGAAIEHGVGEIECDEALQERIEAVMTMSADHDVEYLILGAFGCGVFKNNPERVANLFKQWIDEHPGVFETVVFAIHGNGENLDGFRKVFK